MSAGIPEDDLPERTEGPLLAALSVVELFGRYTYQIRVAPDSEGVPSRLLLLYGDNGSGKTTVLNILFHLLSPAPDRGHRSYLARVPFRSFKVAFVDGTRLEINRQAGLTGTYSISLHRLGVESVSVLFEADESLNLVGGQGDISEEVLEELRGEQQGILFEHMAPTYRQTLENRLSKDELIRFLRDSNIRPVFLADDRSIYSDDEENARARIDERRHFDSRRPEIESAGELVSRELNIAVRRVNDWLRTLTLRGQRVGSDGANSIYLDVLSTLAHSSSPTPPPVSTDQAAQNALSLVNRLAESSPRFEEFELVPHFDSEEFRMLLKSIPDDRQEMAQTILAPYLTSLQARIAGLEEAERVLRVLLGLLNRFLVDKQFTFNPRSGLRIRTADGSRLPVRSLSSGERQLTMILCSTLLARRGSRLFIIDEPELSLGIRWQREVLQALLDLTEGSSLQFVVATHSVEIITSAREYLVPLRRAPISEG